MVNVNYHAARMRGKFNRSLYQSLLPWMVKHPVHRSVTIPVAVYSMSCERDLPEQAASIYSFLRHTGLPDSFTVISDGSYSQASMQLLRQISSCVDVVNFQDVVKEDLPKRVQSYADNSPMGKKLAIELSLPVKQATIYVDSDVLFFPGARELIGLCQSRDERCWYLPDLPGALDKRLLCGDAEKRDPVNGGFMLLKKPLNWQFALDRLRQLPEPPGYFTEQTLLHLTMHYNQASPLDSEKFVLQIGDQFQYADMYINDDTALRHYVSTVRHKFWFNIT